MKKILYSVSLLFFLICTPTLSQKCYNSASETKLSKISGAPSRTHFNINNISTWIYNNGDQDIAPTGNSGFEYPKGSTKFAVFESGLIWGGKIDNQIYVGGSTYTQGILPGRVLPNGEREIGIDGDRVRIFRVRTDWKNGDQSTEVNDKEGTEEEIRFQYEKDWNEWPADWGAPFNDIDNNGIYNPSIDIPGVPGADQTIWYVANDLDTATSRSLYGSDPMGVELQVTIWGYNIPGHLENVMFKKYKLINKSDKDFSDMYFAQWSDIDLGNAGDDHLGIDTLLNIMYGYNGDDYDEEFSYYSSTGFHERLTYGYTPPAVGFQLLQGPIVNSDGNTAYSNGKMISDFKNLDYTSLYFYTCGGNDQFWNDPNLGEYQSGTLQMYAHMQGLHFDYSPMEIPKIVGGGITKFPLSGNPITGEGWINGTLHNPCDIKGLSSSGLFSISSGQSQEIVFAQIAAQGTNRLNSVALLKYYASILQRDYPNITPTNQYPKIAGIAPKIKNNEFCEFDVLELNIERTDSIEQFAELGYNFQGYKIYQLQELTNERLTGQSIFTYDLKDNYTNINGETYDPSTGYIINDIVMNGTNSGIPKNIIIEKDYILNSQLIKGKTYFYGASAYFYNPNTNKIVETSLKTIAVTFQDGLPGAKYLDKIEEFQTNANSDVSIDIEIVDPSKLTSDTYEVTFGKQYYYLDSDGKWKETNYPDKVGKSLNKHLDQTPSTILPLPSIHAPNSALDLHFMVENNAPDYNYIDAISITFPEGIIINGANNIYSNHDADPVIEGQIVIWKNPWYDSNSPSTDGPFMGGEELIVNINYVEPTFTVDYIIYDDGWSEAYASTDSQYYNLGAGTVNGYGTVNLTGEIGHKFKQIKYWELTNKTKNDLILAEQVLYSSYDYSFWRDTRWWDNSTEKYADESILDGFKIKVSGSFDPPNFISQIELAEPINPSTIFSTSYGSSDSSISINNLLYFGSSNSWAIDNFGVGTNDPAQLEQDYEIRFTGVYDNGTNIGDQRVYKVIEGGQMATCFRMNSSSDLANHPLNPHSGKTEPFLMRIPFEVWNVEDPENQFQVNITFSDRNRNGDENPFFAWNPTNRMYPIIVNSQYDPNQIIQVEDGPDEFNSLATWVLVFWGTNYNLGDIVKITYDNPIEFSDVYTFTMPEAPTDKISPNKYEVFQNYPNPFNPNTKIRYYIPEEGNVTITIYNILGQKVTEVINKTLKAGKYEIEFNGSNFASGVYIYRIEVDSPDKANIYSQTKKMLLLK